MEDAIYALFNAGIAVDLLVPSRSDPGSDVGVRLRPYAKHLPREKMVLGSGGTFSVALSDAIEKAESGRWERLDWAARPWSVDGRPDRHTYGL